VRYGFLDRLRHLADPLAVRVPWRGLASSEHAREVAAGLGAAAQRRQLPDAWARRGGERPRARR
jgi:gamma-glutamyltranspeptidase